MDQVSLYELQVVSNKKSNTQTPLSVNRRDEFLIDYLKNNFDMSESEMHITELSIGDGSLSRAFVASFDNANLTFVDISPSRLKLTRDIIDQTSNALNSKIDFVECNFDTHFHLLPSSKFDIVIALDIMEHVFDVFNFIENCNRILKENGVIFLRVPNIAYIRHRVRLLFGVLPITASWFGPPGKMTAWRDCHGWDGGHLHLFNIPILYQLLDSYGFEIILCRDPGSSFSSLRNLYPNLLFGNPLIIAKKSK